MCLTDSGDELLRSQIRKFTESEIKPYADEIDQSEVFNARIIDALASEGFLGASLSTIYGGKGWSQRHVGILDQEIGRVCSSTRSLLTVHLALVGQTIQRWGSAGQKERWLPSLSSGKKIAAFCLTEPGAGSDAQSISSSYKQRGRDFILSGTKKWITFGQRADVLLFFARRENVISAFLVDSDRPGVKRIPIRGMLGTRGSELAEIHLENCVVDEDCIIGGEGAGFLPIANTALDNGRFSVANGSLGIAKACLDESIQYANTRNQFGLLKNHQLIKQKIANMLTNNEAASLLCFQAAVMRDEKNPDALMKTSMAKYFASRIANTAAYEAIQIHGALGCHLSSPVQRYYRDARILEIIEGSSELQQIIIADMGINGY